MNWKVLGIIGIVLAAGLMISGPQSSGASGPVLYVLCGGHYGPWGTGGHLDATNMQYFWQVLANPATNTAYLSDSLAWLWRRICTGGDPSYLLPTDGVVYDVPIEAVNFTPDSKASVENWARGRGYGTLRWVETMDGLQATAAEIKPHLAKRPPVVAIKNTGVELFIYPYDMSGNRQSYSKTVESIRGVSRRYVLWNTKRVFTQGYPIEALDYYAIVENKIPLVEMNPSSFLYVPTTTPNQIGTPYQVFGVYPVSDLPWILWLRIHGFAVPSTPAELIDAYDSLGWIGPTFPSGVKVHSFSYPNSDLWWGKLTALIVWDTKKAYLGGSSVNNLALRGAVPLIRDLSLHASDNSLPVLLLRKGIQYTGLSATGAFDQIRPYLPSDFSSKLGAQSSGVTAHWFGTRREEDYWGSCVVVWNTKRWYSTDDWTKTLISGKTILIVGSGIGRASDWATFLGLTYGGGQASLFKGEIEPYLPGGSNIAIDFSINNQPLTKEATVHVTSPVTIRGRVQAGQDKIQKIEVLLTRIFPVGSTGQPVEQRFTLNKIDASTYELQLPLADGKYDLKVIVVDSAGTQFYLLSLTMEQPRSIMFFSMYLILAAVAIIGCLTLALLWRKYRD